MKSFPDLSIGSRRRVQLSVGLTVLLAASTFLNEYRKSEAQSRQQAMEQQRTGNQSSVEQENNAFWGLVGLFGQTMNANMEQMKKETDADQAEFERRFEIEQREKRDEQDRNERDK